MVTARWTVELARTYSKNALKIRYCEILRIHWNATLQKQSNKCEGFRDSFWILLTANFTGAVLILVFTVGALTTGTGWNTSFGLCRGSPGTNMTIHLLVSIVDHSLQPAGNSWTASGGSVPAYQIQASILCIWSQLPAEKMTHPHIKTHGKPRAWGKSYQWAFF